jgi:transaldolase
MSIRSLINTGSKIWLDSVDPDLVRKYAQLGVTGATSNPAIVADLVRTGRFDHLIETFIERGMDDSAIAWNLTDSMVSDAQEVFQEVWESTRADDGYVSFELDPLLDDRQLGPSHQKRVQAYIELGKHWARGYTNRMIKVPATAAGLDALEELAAAGVTINVTLMFTPRQYLAARDAIWRGAQRRRSLQRFKSVYSIFLSRIDVYASQKLPELSPAARGQVALLNARRIWQSNQDFWRDKRLPLRQEIIFASTGAKLEGDAPDKYVQALAGSDIQTNPPETLEAVEQGGKTYRRTIDAMPPQAVVDGIDARVDMEQLELALMEEGVEKFSKPMKTLLDLIGRKRAALVGA